MCQRKEGSQEKALTQPGAAEKILELMSAAFHLRALSSHPVEVNISGLNIYYPKVTYFDPLHINSLVSRKVCLPHFCLSFDEHLVWKIFYFTLCTQLGQVL